MTDEPTLTLNKKEALDLLATLRDWRTSLLDPNNPDDTTKGFLVDPDDEKDGLTVERFNAIAQRLEQFTAKPPPRFTKSP
tara:strand:- start:303 stop:542 length:240 start_codon:yes stop_codon:yes gene_type:complete